MRQIYNFSAGPGMLPEAVLKQAQAEMLDWQGSGMSVMEMSHRGDEFMSIAAEAEADLREILAIPANYKVLFLQGGASTQFAMIPQNLLGAKTTADYLDTGDWSIRAIDEMRKFGEVKVVASAKDSHYTTVPAFDTWQLNQQAAYLHITPNETIRGVEFSDLPDAGDVPIIADLSSTILSRPLDVSRYGMIYAGAQKNIGPAGLTIVIIRDDLIGHASASVPTMLNYQTHSQNDSMYNTPPTYAWYIAGLVFKWLKTQGGLAGMAALNQRKASKLYAAIDNSNGFYRSPVDVNYRSWMNIPFTLADNRLDKSFLAEAEQVGLKTLKGHRVVGGMRASLYNAMPEAGVDALVDFMQAFAAQYA
jgi:phosphoserine aminotransferase